MDTLQAIVDSISTTPDSIKGMIDGTVPGASVVNEAVATAHTAHAWANHFARQILEIAPSFLMAIIIFFVGKFAAGVARKVAVQMMTKAKIDPTLIGFATNLGYVTIMVIVTIASLSKIGFQTTSFVAILGAAGLAVGLALQGSLSNFASGVLMIIFKPFKVGDFIEAGTVTGTVIEISIFTTTLSTPDNKKVIVPNAKITGDNITNFGANGTRRVDMSVGISYTDDMQKTKELLLAMLAADSRILKDPAPIVAVTELGDSSVNFVVRPWCKSANYWDVRFDMVQSIKEVLDKNDISIPFPQQDVHHYYPETPQEKVLSLSHPKTRTLAKEDEGDE